MVIGESFVNFSKDATHSVYIESQFGINTVTPNTVTDIHGGMVVGTSNTYLSAIDVDDGEMVLETELYVNQSSMTDSNSQVGVNGNVGLFNQLYFGVSSAENRLSFMNDITNNIFVIRYDSDVTYKTLRMYSAASMQMRPTADIVGMFLDNGSVSIGTDDDLKRTKLLNLYGDQPELRIESTNLSTQLNFRSGSTTGETNQGFIGYDNAVGSGEYLLFRGDDGVARVDGATLQIDQAGKIDIAYNEVVGVHHRMMFSWMLMVMLTQEHIT